MYVCTVTPATLPIDAPNAGDFGLVWSSSGESGIGSCLNAEFFCQPQLNQIHLKRISTLLAYNDCNGEIEGPPGGRRVPGSFATGKAALFTYTPQESDWNHRNTIVAL